MLFSLRDILLVQNDIQKIKEIIDSISARRKIYDEDNKKVHELTPLLIL